MSEKEQYQLMDRVVSTTITNFLIEINRNNGFAFKEFDPTNIKHAYAFEVGFIVSYSIHQPLYLQMSFFNYWKFKLKNWSIRKNFQRYKKNSDIKLITIEEILHFMMKSMDLESNIYDVIYRLYYEGNNENRSIYRWKRKK